MFKFKIVTVSRGDSFLFQFEWAWQHPTKSRRLRTLSGKSKNETAYEFKLRIVSNMLRTGPWCRLALTIRWLVQDYRRDFHPTLQPPYHMALAFGRVTAVNRIGEKSKCTTQKRGKTVTGTKKNGSAIRNEEEVEEIVEAVSADSAEQEECTLCKRRMVRKTLIIISLRRFATV